jgi:hypothetical protein
MLNVECSMTGPPFNIQHSAFNIREALVGLGRFELPTSRLSGVRSNQLSYRPVRLQALLSAAFQNGHLCRSVRLS